MPFVQVSQGLVSSIPDHLTRLHFQSTSFHPLTNRKHHCRLCGQVICSLPAKMPRRPAPCSLLFVVDSKTRIIEEVGEGVDYGVRIKPQGFKLEEEKFLKGVRICRACRPVLLWVYSLRYLGSLFTAHPHTRRQQHQQEIHHVPAFVVLYDVGSSASLLNVAPEWFLPRH